MNDELTIMPAAYGGFVVVRRGSQGYASTHLYAGNLADCLDFLRVTLEAIAFNTPPAVMTLPVDRAA